MFSSLSIDFDYEGEPWPGERSVRLRAEKESKERKEERKGKERNHAIQDKWDVTLDNFEIFH